MTDLKVLYETAESQYRARNYAAAEASFRQLSEELSEHDARGRGRALYGHALALIGLGRDIDAQDSLARALRYDPDLQRAKDRLSEIKQRLEAPAAVQKPPLTLEPSQGAIYGVVSGLSVRQEIDELTRKSNALMSFRLNRLDVPKGSAPPLPVQFRAPRIVGTIQNGDWIEFPKGWKPGEKPTSVINLVTGEAVTGQRNKLNISRIARIAITAFVVAWIVVLFAVVAVELGPQLFDRLFGS